uniref:Bacterial surface antigen (D15) domain-containing protein n=1 Tax=Aegilops tauschii subsp. strangulata TaxID=200361 RepID=A0A453AND2_AEGTS
MPARGSAGSTCSRPSTSRSMPARPNCPAPPTSSLRSSSPPSPSAATLASSPSRRQKHGHWKGLLSGRIWLAMQTSGMLQLHMVGTKQQRHHDLSYNLTWRTLTDPSRLASTSIRRQLGHNLLSALKYTYKIDQRDSHIRPTKGYAFLSSSQVGGLWDNKGLNFFRQEFDARAAVPFGFWNAALNVGVGAGVVLPLARGFMNSSTPVTDRFNLGGHSSPVCSLGGISSLLGFRTRGVGPTEAQRLVPGTSEDGSAAVPGRDYLGGDLAVSAFADLSFDLPLKVFRDAGIHGHAFLTAGNLVKLSEGQYKNLSLDEFRRSFRSSAGVGIILPTKLFRVEVNYCYILKQSQHDSGKTGIQFSFSSPS